MNDQKMGRDTWLGAAKALIEHHKLPSNYTSTVEKWLLPLATDIANQIIAPKQGVSRSQLVVGVQGSQGSGKSTSTAFVKILLEECFGLKTAVLSIDDFYLGHQARQVLSEDIHPLLKTRGVPGTHDIELAIETINQMKALNVGETMALPSFDKAQDDCLPRSEWRQIEGPIDIILLEGWFVGINAQPLDSLEQAVNQLEQEEDARGTWRHYVNNKLSGEYQLLFCLLDYQVVLQAPNFDCVFNWRAKQEQKLLESISSGDLEHNRIQDNTSLKRFIAHYERLTMHAISIMPSKANWCFYLDEGQNITRVDKNTRALDNDVRAPEYNLPSEDYFPSKPLLVVTDLDGTLLDHYTYTYAPAFDSVKQLKSLNIPIIINSSKTFSEITEIQTMMGISAPFIVENGSAMYVPKDYFLAEKLRRVANMDEHADDYYVIAFGESRSYILKQLERLKSEFSFQGFSDWDLEKVKEQTGLSDAEAKKSMERGFSEPFLWQDSKEKFEAFERRLLQANLYLKQGGRFFHVIGRTEKAKPVLLLRRLYDFMLQSQKAKSNFSAFKLACLGDSENDKEMLEIADYPVCVRSPIHDFTVLNTKKDVIRTRFMGPTGWAEAMETILLEF